MHKGYPVGTPVISTVEYDADERRVGVTLAPRDTIHGCSEPGCCGPDLHYYVVEWEDGTVEDHVPDWGIERRT